VKRLFFIRISSFILPRKFYLPNPLFAGGITVLFSTPGHSPGHVSVAIRSQGQDAAIMGDLIHNPIQFADPGICANFDFDQKVGLATRQAFINNHADRDVLVLGTHFPTPAVGHIVRDGEGWRFTPVGASGS
jgi:glyoxylase-like metal-dependent hydrolase (beta-lactamase superfamily II)